MGSAILHGSLCGVLLICSAFLSDKPKVEQDNVITIVDVNGIKLTDGASHGGQSANPLPTPPVATAPPQKTAAAAPRDVAPPEPVRVPKPQPKPEVVEKTEEPTERGDFQVKKSQKRHPTVDISTSKMVVKNATKRQNRRQTTSEQDDQGEAQENAKIKRLAGAFSSAASRIGSSVQSGTTVDVGEGGGGEAFINYGEFIKAIYDRAWLDPQDVLDDAASVKVEITIRNDGTVVASHVLRHSGISSMDRSVQRALDRVQSVKPFPPGAKDRERTFILNFNLKSKRQIG